MNITVDVEISLHKDRQGEYKAAFLSSIENERLQQAGPCPVIFAFQRLADARAQPDRYGALLTDGLFTAPELRGALSAARDQARAMHSALRLRLYIQDSAPELHGLYWELLQDPEHRHRLVDRDDVFFSRYQPGWIELLVPRARGGALTSLGVIANPGGAEKHALPSLDAATELARCRAALAGTHAAFLTACTLEHILERSRGQDILYLACQAVPVKGGDWALILEDKNGRVQRVTGADLAARLAGLATRPRLVVLVAPDLPGQEVSLDLPGGSLLPNPKYLPTKDTSGALPPDDPPPVNPPVIPPVIPPLQDLALGEPAGQVDPLPAASLPPVNSKPAGRLTGSLFPRDRGLVEDEHLSLDARPAGANGPPRLPSARDAFRDLAPHLIEAGIPAVLLFQGPQPGLAAERFLPVFLYELQGDGQVDRAAARARQGLRDLGESWSPVLYTRMHSGQLWYSPARGETVALAPRQAPPAPSHFTGRENEIAAVLDGLRRASEHAALARVPASSNAPTTPLQKVVVNLPPDDRSEVIEYSVVAIHGPGGVGKTALACRLAELLAARYPDGQLFVDLKGIDDPQTGGLPVSPPPNQPSAPEQVLMQLLQSYHPLAPHPYDLEILKSSLMKELSGRRALIVLDNAQRLEQVRALLPPPKGCLVILTSRQLLPVHDQLEVALRPLPEAAAAQLLTGIAPRAAPETAGIFQSTGGLPLDLRTAGSLLMKYPALDPSGLCDLIDQSAASQAHAISGKGEPRVRMPAGGSPTLAISYTLLAARLQRLWCRLAVFAAGDFDLRAAAAVWNVPSETIDQGPQLSQAGEIMAELLEHNLVMYEEWSGRFRLHDLARNLAERQLSAEEGAQAARAHARYFLFLLQRADNLYLKGGQRTLDGLALFDRERHQICAGQQWAAEGGSDDRDRLDLCSQYPYAGALCLSLRMNPEEWMGWLLSGLRAASLLGKRALEANHLNDIGRAYASLGRFDKAVKYFQRYLSIARDQADQSGVANALNNLGRAYYDLGNRDQAQSYYQLALPAARKANDRRTERNLLFNLADLAAAGGAPGQTRPVTGRKDGSHLNPPDQRSADKHAADLRRAAEYFEMALTIDRRLGERANEAATLLHLGRVRVELGETQWANECFRRAVDAYRETGDQSGVGAGLSGLGQASLHDNDFSAAIGYFEDELKIRRALGDAHSEAICLWNMGATYEKLGDLRRAVLLMQKCVDYERSVRSPEAEPDAARIEAIKDRIR